VVIHSGFALGQARLRGVLKRAWSWLVFRDAEGPCSAEAHGIGGPS
jgi:hypothetical protein